MNPTPTDAQWLVLYQVDDGEVWCSGDGAWRARSPVGHFDVTRIITRLLHLGLVWFPAEGGIQVTGRGHEVLKRRSVYDVLERRNRRGR